MLHTGNHQVLDETGTAKKFSFQIKSRNGCSHQAVIALGLLRGVVQDFFARLIVEVQVPIRHGLRCRRRTDDPILDRDSGHRRTASRTKASERNGLDGCAGHANRFATVFNRKATRGDPLVRAVLGIDGGMDDLRHGDVELFRCYLCERC